MITIIDIQFDNLNLLEFSSQTSDVFEKRVTEILTDILREEQLADQQFELEINMVDNEEIREINHLYRGIDRATDVISFALQDDAEQIVSADPLYPTLLGTIIVSVEKMKEQAGEYKHSEERELFFLIIHGFLHLLGYDHIDKMEEEVMFSKQTYFLDKYHIKR